MPSASFTHAADASGSPEEVWDRLQEVESWANIGPIEEVWDPVHEGASLRGYRWSATVGPTKYNGTAKVVESARPGRIRLALDAKEMVGELTTDISANGDGAARISVTLAVESRGMLSTLFFPVVSEAVGNGLPKQVEAFAASLEEE
jgi:hypothetical protein